MIPYIEDFCTDIADEAFDFIRQQPFVRPDNKRNKTTRLRRLSFPGYSPSLKGAHHVASDYDVSGTVEDAPPIYKRIANRTTEYAASQALPGPANYMSTIGYLTDDHMNFHQHEEDKKRKDMTVYVVSFGAVHPVAIRPLGSKDKSQYEIIHPKHGSLYVLPSSYNLTHEHAVLEGNDYSFGGLRIAVNMKHIPIPGPQVRTSRILYPDAVYVGRQVTRGNIKYEDTPWGNHGKEPDMAKFRETALKLMQDDTFRAVTYEHLRGKDLLCPWCATEKERENCHARVWLEIANS